MPVEWKMDDQSVAAGLRGIMPDLLGKATGGVGAEKEEEKDQMSHRPGRLAGDGSSYG
jgi:hypothetical protein